MLQFSDADLENSKHGIAPLISKVALNCVPLKGVLGLLSSRMTRSSLGQAFNGLTAFLFQAMSPAETFNAALQGVLSNHANEFQK